MDGTPGNTDSASPRKVFTMLENNPTVMTDLAHKLGASTKLRFYDIYSLTEPEMLALTPRPVYALLATIPMTSSWKHNRETENHHVKWYEGSGTAEPVIWFRQTIIDACGFIGLLHCLSNGVPSEMITPDSELAKFLQKAIPLRMNERAKLLSDTEVLAELNEAAAKNGDTEIWQPGTEKLPNHYLALVKGGDGTLWELEGGRKGPLSRGHLGEDEDALSDRALELGIKRLIEIQQGADDNMRFSCIALALSPE